MQAYTNGAGFRSQPDLNEEIKKMKFEAAEETKRKSQQHPADDPEVLNTKTSAGAPFKLPHDLLKLVETKVALLKGSPGFGIRTVRAVAASVFATHTDRLFPGGGVSENHEWKPSDAWCYNFLHKTMGFKWRRITGKKVEHISTLCLLVTLAVQPRSIGETANSPDCANGASGFGPCRRSIA